MSTSRARRDGLYLMLLGSIAFLGIGIVLDSADRVPMLDFRTAWFSGQCLLQHCDPYGEGQMQNLYAAHAERFPVTDRNRQIVTRNIYLPSAFAFTVPLALVPFTVAEVLWFILIAGSFMIASSLMWDLAAGRAPILAGALICFVLANSGSILYFGNPAGFVVPLTVISAWCFVRQRYVAGGIACLAVGLAFKPHDAGLVWLYFLLAGGIYRKRALQTFVVVAALSIPMVLWVQHLSPYWLGEISENLNAYSVRGGINDPSAGHGALVLTNLQTVTSFFLHSQRAYDLASYTICAPLLVLWAVVVRRARPSIENAWLALASISALSMLPLYHRQYDAKLILLAIPACALLWSERGPVAWIGLAINGAAFFLNGDIPWIIFLSTVRKLHISQTGPHGRLLTAIWDFPVPLSLLALGSFYIWAYERRSRDIAPGKRPADAAGETAKQAVV